MMSARYFALALHRLGVQAAVVDPCTDIWPVVRVRGDLYVFPRHPV
jgi:hypothetical protein